MTGSMAVSKDGPQYRFVIPGSRPRLSSRARARIALLVVETFDRSSDAKPDNSHSCPDRRVHPNGRKREGTDRRRNSRREAPILVHHRASARYMHTAHASFAALYSGRLQSRAHRQQTDWPAISGRTTWRERCWQANSSIQLHALHRRDQSAVTALVDVSEPDRTRWHAVPSAGCPNRQSGRAHRREPELALWGSAPSKRDLLCLLRQHGPARKPAQGRRVHRSPPIQYAPPLSRRPANSTSDDALTDPRFNCFGPA